MDRRPDVDAPAQAGPKAPGRISLRRFLQAAGAAGTLGGAMLPALLEAQEVTKDSLQVVVRAGDLAITDAQVEKLAPAVAWSVGEMKKLRDVEVGLGGPAPIFLPAASGRGGDRDE